jgi:hypothetical protein
MTRSDARLVADSAGALAEEAIHRASDHLSAGRLREARSASEVALAASQVALWLETAHDLHADDEVTISFAVPMTYGEAVDVLGRAVPVLAAELGKVGGAA